MTASPPAKPIRAVKTDTAETAEDAKLDSSAPVELPRNKKRGAKARANAQATPSVAKIRAKAAQDKPGKGRGGRAGNDDGPRKAPRNAAQLARQARKAERELARAEAETAKQAAIQNAAAPVRQARTKGRHYLIFTSFFFLVLLPTALTAWYLWERATDQYASYVGFSVRTEEQGSSIEGLFGMSELSGSSSSDTDILYEFLQSQHLVAIVDGRLDLREIWSRPGKAADPVFAYDPPGTIEDLTDHWAKKVKIYYESTSGLMDLRVQAFTAEEAQAIAQAIYEESSKMINQLSAIAREDAIGYAREELEMAQDQLKQARLDIQAFRNRTQIVDPAVRSQSQSGLIGALESELANAQIDLQLLKDTARATDPRIAQTERRIAAVRRQISEERSELGIENSEHSGSVADLVGQYETLEVDLQFAQEAYTAARAAFDAARNEARRKSRYLAAHVPPTLAEKSEFPDRNSILALVALFSFMTWAFLVLAAYAVRDRR